MSENIRLRNLGTFERFYWLISQIQPMHISVAALVEGSTTVEQWCEALSAVQRRHPLFAASIKTDANGAAYFRKEPTTPIPLRVVEGNALSQLDVEVARELATPFSSTEIPLVRAVLLHEKQRSIVILVVNHSMADAISLVYAIRDIVQSISGHALDRLPVPLSNEESLGLSHPTENNVGEQELHADAGSNGASAVTASFHPKPPEVAAQVKSLRLTEELTRTIRERAREEKASMQSVLASSLFFTVQQLAAAEDRARPSGGASSSAKKLLGLHCPTSSRKLLKRGEEVALITDGGPIDWDIPDTTSFWDRARHVKSKVSLLQSLEHAIASRSRFQEFFDPLRDPEVVVQVASKMIDVEAARYHFAISNLGDLSLESQYGSLKLEAIWGPGHMMGTFDIHFLGVATMNGRLSFLYSSYHPLPHLLETLEKVLIDTCAASSSGPKIATESPVFSNIQ
jgi:hypothetical protein